MINVNLADYEKMTVDELELAVKQGDIASKFVYSVYLLGKHLKTDYALELMEESAWGECQNAILFLPILYSGKTRHPQVAANREKEILYMALQEQYNQKPAIKMLAKIANGKNGQEKKYLAAATRRVLVEGLRIAFRKAAAKKADSVLITLSVADSKSVYYVDAFFGNNLELSDEGIDIQITHTHNYAAIMRNRSKKLRAEEYLLQVKNMLIEVLQGSELPTANYSRVGFSIKGKGELIKNESLEQSVQQEEQPVETAEQSDQKQPSSRSAVDTSRDEELYDTDLNVNLIKSDAPLTLLQCSQCGDTAINLQQAANGYAVCEACGSTFAINHDRLGKANSGGFDIEAVKMAMPRGAKIPKFKFSARTILNGELTMVMPKDFVLMSEELRKIKYPTPNAPTVIYTNERGTVNIAFTPKDDEIGNDDIAEFTEATTNMIKMMNQSINFFDNKTIVINNNNIGYYDFITKAKDTDIYNFMFMMSLNGKLLQGAFNCVADERWLWYEIFRMMLNTFTTIPAR